MKNIITVGKPTHFRPTSKKISSCGIVNPKFSSYDFRDCNCIRCMKTKEYKFWSKE